MGKEAEPGKAEWVEKVDGGVAAEVVAETGEDLWSELIAMGGRKEYQFFYNWYSSVFYIKIGRVYNKILHIDNPPPD